MVLQPCSRSLSYSPFQSKSFAYFHSISIIYYALHSSHRASDWCKFSICTVCILLIACPCRTRCYIQIISYFIKSILLIVCHFKMQYADTAATIVNVNIVRVGVCECSRYSEVTISIFFHPPILIVTSSVSNDNSAECTHRQHAFSIRPEMNYDKIRWHSCCCRVSNNWLSFFSLFF